MTPPTIPHQGFYEVSATVIPVLFLALIFQMRWFEADNRKAPQFALFDLAIIIVAIVGEVICIGALSEDRAPTEVERVAVLCAITLMFLPIMFRALLPRVEAITSGWPRFPVLAQTVFFGYFVIAVAVAIIVHVSFPVILAVGALLFLAFVLALNSLAEVRGKGDAARQIVEKPDADAEE